MTHPLLKRAVLATALALGSTLASAADVTGGLTLTSDYLFDGFTQTQNKAALQGNIDWAHDSGFYAGAWASNVDFGDGTDSALELDTAFGYSFGSDGMFDAGFVRYTYMGDGFGGSDDEIDYDELYFGVNFSEHTSLKVWHARDYVSSGEATQRIKFSHSIPLNDAWTLAMEFTHSKLSKVYDEDANHFRIGVGTSVAGFDFDLSYHKTDADPSIFYGVHDDKLTAKDGLLVLTFSKAFGGE